MGSLVFSEQQLLDWVAGYLWPLFRISGFFMVVPVFGTQLVPARIRLALSLATALVIAPSTAPPSIDLLSLPALFITAQEILIGITFGFFLQFVFQVFVLAGQTMAMQMGLGMAQMNDPVNGVSVTVLSQLYLILSTLLFLSMNGHVVALMIFTESFRVLPIGESLPLASVWAMAGTASWMLATALLLALPAIISLLAVNMSFGIMNRSAAQLNIFSIGFPMTMVLGLIIVYISLTGFLPRYQAILEQGFVMMRQLLPVP